MKRKRFSEEQIIGILREHQAGVKASDLCRRHAISEATLYNWRSRYGGMQVSEAKRLRSLEEENRKLKKLLAEAMLDNAALKDSTADRCDGERRRRQSSMPGASPERGGRSGEANLNSVHLVCLTLSPQQDAI